MEAKISHERLKDEIEKKKAKGHEKNSKNRAEKWLLPVSNFIGQVIKRATHHTVHFIRWLHYVLYIECTIAQALAMLNPVLSLEKHELFHTDRC